MFGPVWTLFRTSRRVARDLIALISSAIRSRAQLAAENLFLRKQLALYVERRVKPRRADDATCITLVTLSPFRKLAASADHRKTEDAHPMASKGLPVVVARRASSTCRFQMIDLLAQPIVLSLEAIMLALRLVALALGAFRPFSQVFDLTSGPIVQGWVA